MCMWLVLSLTSGAPPLAPTATPLPHTTCARVADPFSVVRPVAHAQDIELNHPHMDTFKYNCPYSACVASQPSFAIRPRGGGCGPSKAVGSPVAEAVNSDTSSEQVGLEMGMPPSKQTRGEVPPDGSDGDTKPSKQTDAAVVDDRALTIAHLAGGGVPTTHGVGVSVRETGNAVVSAENPATGGRDVLSVDLKRMAMSVTERLSRFVQQVTQPSIDTQVLKALGTLDDRLVEALRRRDIRLVRTAWLNNQSTGYRIKRRQELEALENSGVSPSPLMSAEEAVALVGRGTRSTGALTYPW